MFSVVIPLYNKAHIIEQTLKSVFNQTYSNFEVIVIDDGSTDNGTEIINSHEEFRTVRIIKQPNQGVSVARNNGIANAVFNYVALLDGDDEWMPGFLAEMHNAITLFPDAGFYGSSSWHRDILTGEQSEHTPDKYRNKILEFDFFRNPHQMPHTSAVVLNKKIFCSIFPDGRGFPPGMKLFEDLSCFYQIAFEAPVIYAGYPLAIRNNNVSGQITGTSKRERGEFIKYIAYFYNLIYSVWQRKEIKPAGYIPFLKYDLRCVIISFLRADDVDAVDRFITSLGNECRAQLNTLERNIYPKSSLKKLSILYIYYTKILWKISHKSD